VLLDGDSHTKFESRLHGVGERNSPDVIRAIQSVRLTWEAINSRGTSYTMDPSEPGQHDCLIGRGGKVSTLMYLLASRLCLT
jgi:hypothetical protein